MNDLTVTLDPTIAIDDLNSTTFAGSIAASDFSFQKIQAAFDPIKSLLSNRGLIKDIIPIHISKTNIFLLCQPDNIVNPTLFFGNVSLRGTMDDGFSTDLFRLETLDPNGNARLLRRGCATAGSGAINSSIRNTFIERVDTGDSDVAFDAFGLLILLKTQITVEDEAAFEVPVEYVQEFVAADTPRASLAILDFWDMSGAPRIFPDRFKPKRLQPFFGNVDPVLVNESPETWITPVPGTTIPRNFYNFLQYVHARLEDGSSYVVPAGPQPPPNVAAAMITDIVMQVRAGEGLVTLGDSKTRFVLPTYEYNADKSVDSVAGLNNRLTFSLLSADPDDKSRVAFVRVDTPGAVVGKARGVVSFGFPNRTLVSGVPPTKQKSPVAADLTEFHFSQISISLLPSLVNLGPGFDAFGEVDSTLKTYASAFEYPNVPIS